MRVLTIFVMFQLGAASFVLAQEPRTVMVVGAVRTADRVLQPNIRVGLFCTTGKACAKGQVGGDSKDTPRGVYAVHRPNTDVSTLDRLYVVYDGSDKGLTGNIEVRLNCGNEQPCILFAEDLIVYPIPLQNQPAEVAKWINTNFRSNQIRAQAGMVSDADAINASDSMAAYVVGITSPENRSEQHLDEVITELKKIRVDGKQPTTFPGDATFRRTILNHSDFKRTKEIRIGPKEIQNPASLSPDQIQKLLTTPKTSIQKEWIDSDAFRKPIENLLQSSKKSGTVQIGVRNPTTPNAPFRPLVMNPMGGGDDAAKRLADEHPEIRTWVVLDKLKKDNNKLTQGQQLQLRQRLDSNRPIVVPAK